MRFRRCHYMPCPFRGDKFEIGRLVEDEKGVRFVDAERFPTAKQLGSQIAHRSMRWCLAALYDLKRFFPERGFASQLLLIGPVENA